MATYKQRTEAVIAKLKKQSFKTLVLSGIYQKESFQLFFLTADCVNNDHVISLLSAWRKKHEAWFPAQFPVSVERTRGWFAKRVTDASDRLLFMISIHGTYIGHVGLFRFDFKHNICEIDNIVRGEDGYPGIMAEAILVMMRWGEEALEIQRYSLETTSDNERALNLYKRLGFVEVKRKPYVARKTADGVEWYIPRRDYKKPVTKYVVFMESGRRKTK